MSNQEATPAAATGDGAAAGRDGGCHPGGGIHCSRAGGLGHGPAMGWAAPEPPTAGHTLGALLAAVLDDETDKELTKLSHIEASDGGEGGVVAGAAGAGAGAGGSSLRPLSYQLRTGLRGGSHPGGGFHCSRVGVLGHGPLIG